MPERKKNSVIAIMSPRASDRYEKGDFWNLYEKIMVGIANIINVLTKNTCSDPAFSLNMPTKANPNPVIANRAKKRMLDDDRQNKYAEIKLNKPRIKRDEL